MFVLQGTSRIIRSLVGPEEGEDDEEEEVSLPSGEETGESDSVLASAGAAEVGFLPPTDCASGRLVLTRCAEISPCLSTMYSALTPSIFKPKSYSGTCTFRDIRSATLSSWISRRVPDESLSPTMTKASIYKRQWRVYAVRLPTGAVHPRLPHPRLHRH